MSRQDVLFLGRGAAAAFRRPIGALRLPVATWAGQNRGWRGRVHRVAQLMLAVGLLTMSWDRLLNLQIASYNVKLPSCVLSVACLLALVSAVDRRRALFGTRLHRALLGLTAVIVVYLAVRGFFSAEPAASAAQILAILSGAVLPALTVLLLVRTREDFERSLRWVLAGAAVASAFGCYQLLAFYLGWPQGITYTGVGIGTGIGRISAFNYEPAYFAYYVVLALGAFIALRRLEGRDIRWRELVAFAAILYLANVRAAPLVVLAFGLLLLLAFRLNRRLLIRGAVVAGVTVIVALAVPPLVAAVQSVQATLAQDGDRSSANRADGRDDRGPAEDARRSTGTSAARGSAQALRSQLQTVDPAEPSSNGPRLALYRAVLAEVATSPVVGLGPGNLAAALRRDSPSTVMDQGAGQVVANNIWLQALADGGGILVVLEGAFIVVVGGAMIRRRTSPAMPLAAAWLAVVLVGGMLTSYFFDIKLWLVLGLLVVGFALVPRALPVPERSIP